MRMEQVIVDLLKSKPDLILTMFLAAVMVILMPIMVLMMAFTKSSARALNRRKFVEDLLKSPETQERIKDPQINFQQLVENLLRSMEPPPEQAPQKVGLFAKMSHDITWDVSGVIGLIVTIVLMIMVVSRTYS